MSHYTRCLNCGEPECMDSDTGVHRRDDGTVCPDPRDAEVEGLRAELAAADRSVDRLSACVSNGDGNIRRLEREAEGLRAEVERLARERDEAEGARILNANALKAALAANEAMGREDYLNKQAIRVGGDAVRELNAEVARLRAAALPEDAEERIKLALYRLHRETWAEKGVEAATLDDPRLNERMVAFARAVLAALRRDA